MAECRAHLEAAAILLDEVIVHSAHCPPVLIQHLGLQSGTVFSALLLAQPGWQIPTPPTPPTAPYRVHVDEPARPLAGLGGSLEAEQRVQLVRALRPLQALEGRQRGAIIPAKSRAVSLHPLHSYGCPPPGLPSPRAPQTRASHPLAHRVPSGSRSPPPPPRSTIPAAAAEGISRAAPSSRQLQAPPSRESTNQRAIQPRHPHLPPITGGRT